MNGQPVAGEDGRKNLIIHRYQHMTRKTGVQTQDVIGSKDEAAEEKPDFRT